MNILLISAYPNKFDKSRSIFVYRLMQSLVTEGCKVVVISPETWRTKDLAYYSPPGEKHYGHELATVYRPKYIDLPNRIRIGKFTLGRYNVQTYKNAVKKTLKDINFKPDIVYAHFLYRSGPAAITAAEYFKVPAVVALGESALEKHESIFGKKNMRKLVHRFSGVISVSEKNKNYCVNELGLAADKIKVFPNSVNHEVFYPRDKQEMRKKYNLPQDKFIVAFTGHFIERKGPLRVLEAINELNQNIGGIFIGSGPQTPNGDKVLFKGRVAHNQVAELLSAADVFVLPTKDEGSCNAVIEAMACGLPIVSSDIEAIREQVNQSNGILCHPENIEEIKNAIHSLFENRDLLMNKTQGALTTAKATSLKMRTSGILNFLNHQIQA